ncbi:allantoinase AllB [Psychrobacillus sp. NPDC096426]|uniref:allantoinase AllB n=1 Tax=Psychrobacillus sp. NPDC096426 TaxID=3364491 RepID=UPI00381527E1
MTYDLIIKNGNVVFHDGVRQVDIGVKNEKITCIAEEITDEAKEVIDAGGQYVMPGMVDTHVHISEPGRTEWEGFETGSKAMAAGGTTSYVEMPLNALPATINKEALDLKLDAAVNQNYVDYGFYGGLVPENLDKLEELAGAGVLAFKCFLSDITSDIPGDFTNVDDYTMYKGMQKIAELGGILCIHAENPSVTSKLTEEMIREGRTSAAEYVDSRPIFTEVDAVQRAILFAKETGCKLHLVHISTSEAVQVILKARLEGVDVTVESCPHYFAMTAEQVAEIGPKAKCQPPIRKAKDQAKLWDELLNGNIDWLTSDHSPCTEDLKQGNIFEAWGGISGVQNNVDLMFDLAVKQRGLAVEKFVHLIAFNPAKRFSLPYKGEIAVSKDADIILLDPNQSYVVKRENLYYKNKHSAYEGRKIDCRVTKTIVRGNVVFDIQQGIVGEPIGKLLSAVK